MAACCQKCGAPLGGDDIAIYRRLVDRGAREYLCANCLADSFGCSRACIDEKIRYFKSIGCLLFVPAIPQKI